MPKIQSLWPEERTFVCWHNVFTHKQEQTVKPTTDDGRRGARRCHNATVPFSLLENIVKRIHVKQRQRICDDSWWNIQSTEAD